VRVSVFALQLVRYYIKKKKKIEKKRKEKTPLVAMTHPA
jgi:hypothetical protein